MARPHPARKRLPNPPPAEITNPMSYILDALKRADAERGRGAVPGLHARQLPGAASAAPSNTPSRVWVVMATAIAITALAASLWIWRTQTHEASLALPVAAVPVPQSVAPQSETVIPKTIVKPSLARPPTTANAMAVPPAGTMSAPVAKAFAPEAAPAALPLLSELPEALRHQIPALTITGTVYSDDPKQRLLLVNNQVLPQGSTVAAEVTLEEIKPHSSVFTFRGTRFRVAH